MERLWICSWYLVTGRGSVCSDREGVGQKIKGRRPGITCRHWVLCFLLGSHGFEITTSGGLEVLLVFSFHVQGHASKACYSSMHTAMNVSFVLKYHKHTLLLPNQ